MPLPRLAGRAPRSGTETTNWRRNSSDGADPLPFVTMTRYHAAWIVPIAAPPIKNGWVDVDAGRVTGVGPPEAHTPSASGQEVDLRSRVVLPGLVNAHTHLELSGLRGAVPPAASMPTWTRRLIARMVESPPNDAAIRAAVAEARRAGTALVGDITNTLASVEPLRHAPIEAVVFKELLGFDERHAIDVVTRALADLDRCRGGRPRLGLAVHAPYSVSPSLFAAVRAAADDRVLGPLSVHVAESRDELEFLRTGAGVWREVLEERGRWDPSWTPPVEGPVAYLDRLGWLRSDTLMIHGVYLTDLELERMARMDVTLVTCPRSNRWTGAGSPPVDRFYASGVRVAVGTDSLASVADLNLFTELRAIRQLGPFVPPSAILRSATLSGAEALGFGDQLGAIVPGYRAALVAVECAEQVDDVEEYLVGGVQPSQVTWLDEIPGDEESRTC